MKTTTSTTSTWMFCWCWQLQRAGGLRAEHKNTKKAGELENETQNKPQSGQAGQPEDPPLEVAPREAARAVKSIHWAYKRNKTNTKRRHTVGICIWLSPCPRPRPQPRRHPLGLPFPPTLAAPPTQPLGNVWGMSVVVTIRITIRVTSAVSADDIGFFFGWSRKAKGGGALLWKNQKAPWHPVNAFYASLARSLSRFPVFLMAALQSSRPPCLVSQLKWVPIYVYGILNCFIWDYYRSSSDRKTINRNEIQLTGILIIHWTRILKYKRTQCGARSFCPSIDKRFSVQFRTSWNC